jgi:hypothetical protein
MGLIKALTNDSKENLYGFYLITLKAMGLP